MRGVARARVVYLLVHRLLDLFGLLTWTGTAPDLEASVWADGGRRLAFLPLILPAVSAVWMWFSDPRRIVVAAERMDELSTSLSERARTQSPGRRP